MYSKNDIQRFNKISNQLLKTTDSALNDLEEAANLVIDLRDVINFHDYQYYVAAEPVITDFEYDKLFKLLKIIEEKFPSLKTPESPTERVALGLTKEFPTVQHLVPMLSLDNSYDEADLLEFDRRVKNLSSQNEIEYTIEPKFDGASVSLVYEDNKLVRAVTRGDGIMGDDITPNIKLIKSIPLKVDLEKYGINTIEIRGEIIISKSKFAKTNAEREKEGLPLLANPRNAAAGSLRMQDKAEIAKRNLDATLYHVSYAADAEGHDLLGTKLKTRSETIEILHNLGFKVPVKEQRTLSSIKEVLSYCDEWEEKREKYDFEIDGMVIKVNNLTLEERLGATSHHPRWAIAYKFKARQARTRLLNVEFQVGRIGTITPVAKLQPVALGGVTVSSASMFNEDFISQKDIRIGDEVFVERAGDVIPYVASVIKESRKGDEKSIEFPTHCPVCENKLEREQNEAAWRCVNTKCPAQQFFRIAHFVSKDAMDIAGLGPATIQKFMENGWINSIPDIYRLPFEKISKLEGFGQKSIDNLLAAIEKSKNMPLHRLIFGLGIRHVGEATARNLADEIECLDDLTGWDIKKLSTIQDIGKTVAESIYSFFKDEETGKMINELKELGVNICQVKAEHKEGGKLSKLTFLFTGSLTKFSRNEAKEMVEEEGGIVANSLSSKVNYLVVGEDAGSKLDKAKKLSTVKIIDEEKFLELLK